MSWKSKLSCVKHCILFMEKRNRKWFRKSKLNPEVRKYYKSEITGLFPGFGFRSAWSSPWSCRGRRRPKVSRDPWSPPRDPRPSWRLSIGFKSKFLRILQISKFFLILVVCRIPLRLRQVLSSKQKGVPFTEFTKLNIVFAYDVLIFKTFKIQQTMSVNVSLFPVLLYN